MNDLQSNPCNYTGTILFLSAENHTVVGLLFPLDCDCFLGSFNFLSSTGEGHTELDLRPFDNQCLQLVLNMVNNMHQNKNKSH